MASMKWRTLIFLGATWLKFWAVWKEETSNWIAALCKWGEKDTSGRWLCFVNREW